MGLPPPHSSPPTTRPGLTRAVLALAQVTLEEPIRYARGDPIEKWLHAVLCLDATNYTPQVSGCPHPSECDLYWVDRDALFSYHSASESFLQRMVALFVASHYKNTPNDLQLMSDAPAHQLYVLLGPVDVNATRLPDVLAVVQARAPWLRHVSLLSCTPAEQPSSAAVPARTPYPLLQPIACLVEYPAYDTRLPYTLPFSRPHTCKLRGA